MTVLLGMLGLGGMRTFEKLKRQNSLMAKIQVTSYRRKKEN